MRKEDGAAIVHSMNISTCEISGAEGAFAERMAELMPRLCRATMQRELSCTHDAGASAQQIWALELICHQKNYPLRQLLVALRMKTSTGTVFVDRLCKSGLVKRAQNPKNRRSVLLALTRKGDAMLRKARQRRAQEARSLFASVPARKRRDYLTLLESLIATLQNSKEVL